MWLDCCSPLYIIKLFFWGVGVEEQCSEVLDLPPEPNNWHFKLMAPLFSIIRQQQQKAKWSGTHMCLCTWAQTHVHTN